MNTKSVLRQSTQPFLEIRALTPGVGLDGATFEVIVRWTSEEIVYRIGRASLKEAYDLAEQVGKHPPGIVAPTFTELIAALPVSAS